MEQQSHLGEFCIEAGLLSQEQIRTALDQQKQKGGFFGQILVENGWLSEQQLCQVLSEQLHVHWANIDCLLITNDILKLVSKGVATTCHVLPIFTRNNTLHLAMEYSDDSLTHHIESQTHMQVKPLLAPSKQLRGMIKYYYFENAALS